jgi:hypothetical protein
MSKYFSSTTFQRKPNFITDIVQEWMQILLKFITNKALEITTDNLRTTRLKTGNKLTNSYTIYIVRPKN